jgi:hypothetical protein
MGWTSKEFEFGSEEEEEVFLFPTGSALALRPTQASYICLDIMAVPMEIKQCGVPSLRVLGLYLHPHSCS